MLTPSVHTEALAKLQSLQEAATNLTNFVRAPAGRAPERLLAACASVRVAIERGVHRGAIIALAMAEAHTEVDLTWRAFLQDRA